MTDPLYILDLTDPADPFIAGELEISGYSDYLHPVGEAHLVGIGKDAIEDSTVWGDGRSAWYKGLKIALFDVSDPANPSEVDSMVIGERGTSSDVLFDHKAVTYLPPGDGLPAKLAIPVELYDTTPTDDWFDPSELWAYYGWTHSGLYMFEIDTTGGLGTAISEVGKVITKDSASTDYQYDYWWGYGAEKRSVILNDSIHYIADGEVWSGSWSSDPAAVGPQ